MVNDVMQVMITRIQNDFSLGVSIRLMKIVAPSNILANKNLNATERIGGMVSNPTFTAAHDEPQIRQTLEYPRNIFKRKDN